MWPRIEYGQWKALLSLQRQRVDKLLPTALTSDENHPIYNFFSTYYRHLPSALRTYSPGIGVMVSTESADDYKVDLPKKGRVAYNDSCVIFDPRSAKFNENQINTLKKTLRVLEATSMRPPNFHCYNLHEWAMLYSKSKPFVTQSLPLRKSLSNKIIREVVETLGPTCTHYDAFRFFSEDAKPLNSSLPLSSKLASEIPLTRNNEEALEHFKQLLKKELSRLESDFPGFDIALTRDWHGAPKPSPEPIVHICEHFELSPQEVVVIGDHLDDVRSGNRANVGLSVLLDETEMNVYHFICCCSL